MADEITLSSVRIAAMNLLAMREHSAGELAEKLGRKFPNPELIIQAIATLKDQNLQSDDRFAEAFVAMRQRQGKGSLLIRMELRDRGVEASLISALIDEADCIWVSLAREVRLKRFNDLPVDGRDKARQMRFLHSRGFANRHIQASFATSADSE